MSGTLYAACKSGEPTRTRAILPKGLVKYFKLDVKVSDPDEHFPSEFPYSRIPAFRYPCGRQLTESIPVNLKLISLIPDNGGLLGNNSPEQYAAIIGWMQIFNIELMDAVAVCLLMKLGLKPYDAKLFDFNWSAIERQLVIINDHLTKNTFLVGEKVTLADLYCVPMCFRGYTVLWDPEHRAKYPAIKRWFETINTSPIYDGFFKNIKYAEKFTRPN